MSSSSEDERPFPEQGRLLGVDYGARRVGIAVSTPEQTIASPLQTYHRRHETEDARHLARLAAEYEIVGLVVGLPVHMSGEEGQKAQEARAFGEWMGRITGLPVRYWDERYTSSIAEVHLLSTGMSKKKRKARIDQLAAQIMLQSYLDSGDRTQAPRPMQRRGEWNG